VEQGEANLDQPDKFGSTCDAIANSKKNEKIIQFISEVRKKRESEGGFAT